MTRNRLLLLFIVLLSCHNVVQSDFGDFVDLDFECPATTTCPVICVNNLSSCPSKSACPDGTTLCPNGACSSSNCEESYEQVNPCPQEDSCSISFACPKVEDIYEICIKDFGEYYDKTEECRQELKKAGKSFNAKPLSVLGIWLVVLTVAVLVWCRCCGNFHPNATQALDECRTQTGYSTPFLGLLLYYAVMATLIGFQVLLLGFATASYYENEEESLRAFEVTWVIGFLWTFLFKWPGSSIRVVFYRRCDLALATVVCVCEPTSTEKSTSPTHHHLLRNTTATRHQGTGVAMALAIIRIVGACFSYALGFFFNISPRGKLHYLPVETYDHGGSSTAPQRYVVFSFRRYNYDAQLQKFIPGNLTVARTVGDVRQVAENTNGLKYNEVQDRLERNGPNVIDMKPPHLWTCIHQEFSKPFYTYQNFILWTWVPLYYFYLALVHGSVIVVGGFTVALFRFRNESNLYKLTHQEGQVEVLRDGKYISVEHSQVVPGDIVRVGSGKLYTDMVLFRTEGLLVDESALTGESNPVPKTAMDILGEDAASAYDPLLKHKKHTLSAGTTVLESELDDNYAVVVATGSYTSKGQLLRDVFAYQRHSFQFDKEVPIVFLILTIECVVAFASVWKLLDEQPVYAWFYGMYVVSTLLPPLLPTVFTVSVGISENRLSKLNIACSNSEDILVAGKVTKAVFDKTGKFSNFFSSLTLTMLLQENDFRSF